MPLTRTQFDALFARKPAMLAPMEDVTDVVFRRIARGFGADACFTEFVNVEGLLRGCKNAKRKMLLSDEDRSGTCPTAIQIYGSNPERLAEAAHVAEASEPAWVDVNCGCWVPKIAGRGAGAGWLRDPDAMVAMAKMVVSSVSCLVTVKTRIGLDEARTPIVDLARRLEDAGVAALTIHCRTAKMGHSGAADWSWAARAREVVSIPVVVNGDVDSAEAAVRAFATTNCAGVMIGRRAIEHPWIFRELGAFQRDGAGAVDHAFPTLEERLALCRNHLEANVSQRGEIHGVRVTRRHLSGYLRGMPGAAELRRTLLFCDTLSGCLDILSDYERRPRAAA